MVEGRTGFQTTIWVQRELTAEPLHKADEEPRSRCDNYDAPSRSLAKR